MHVLVCTPGVAPMYRIGTGIYAYLINSLSPAPSRARPRARAPAPPRPPAHPPAPAPVPAPACARPPPPVCPPGCPPVPARYARAYAGTQAAFLPSPGRLPGRGGRLYLPRLPGGRLVACPDTAGPAQESGTRQRRAREGLTSSGAPLRIAWT